ncbi:FecCD family ABC transporter permease [Clostridium magnum]|uniref:Putative siderophore transport system permease protein YfhA n=1 Tax=Clostridium magnum DSM 2767 TaxID=1121326 RepID=A0A161WRC0_9CLOT|nr:iron ABC transporter permease [Clostridium magnum]KZL89268.1 putative siderophore transport system permease protein YfhA [Clostridium magnum DSM 2767]SHI96715.1 iron complex transport system permease protein [Clostridium magnum DSM 2767]
MKEKRFKITAIIFLVLLLASLIIFLSWGSYRITPLDIIKTLLGQGTKLQKATILDLRLPRLLVGISVGIALSTAGGLLQTITKNELADSSIMGINAGAAVAAVTFISFKTANYYSTLGALSVFVLPVMAILGAGISAIVIYFLSSRKGIRPKRLLLIGLGMNAGLNAFITFFTFRGGAFDYNRVLIWVSGSLWGAGWNYAKIIIPLVALMFMLVLLNYKKLDVLNLSDEHAIALGLSLNRERRKFLTYAVILAGSATAFAGNVGFIGLVCPNIAKKLVGPYHKNFLVISAIISVVIILVADAVSRNLFSPIEIPVGITISIFGVPYFIYLMMKEK